MVCKFVMQTIQSVNEMQSHAIGLRSSGRLIGLVPTMGCLHEGHLSLIDIAKERADKVIVSIFVNPTQFGPSEDFGRYPKSLQADLEKCAERGVDIVFNPSVAEMYPQGYSTYVNEEDVGAGLCGISRPSHFRGVTTVCLKLFNITRPDFAVFGQKDAQPCAVLQQMATDPNIPAHKITAATTRPHHTTRRPHCRRHLHPCVCVFPLPLFSSLSLCIGICRLFSASCVIGMPSLVVKAHIDSLYSLGRGSWETRAEHSNGPS